MGGIKTINMENLKDELKKLQELLNNPDVYKRQIVENTKQFKKGRVVGRDDAVLINKKLRTCLLYTS